MTLAGARSEQALDRALMVLTPTVATVVAAEFIVVGLLPPIARDLRIPLAQAGGLAGWFAFSAAVAGPFVTLAVSPGFAPMLIVRVVQGAVLPAFIGVGAATVMRLAPPSAHGKGLARANIGFVVGLLVALPAGVALAEGGNWRLPFAILAAVSLACVPAIALLFPRISTNGAAGVGGQLVVLRQPRLLAHLALSVLLFASMFAAYTYLGAWVEQTLGVQELGVALVLFLFGAAGLAGSMVAGRFADRALMRATAAAMLTLLAAVNATALSGGAVLLAAVPLAFWSIAHTASVTLSQVRVTLAGRQAPSFAMTLNISAANLGIAIGTLGGGRVIDALGMAGIGVAPVAFAVPALLLLAGLARMRTHSPDPH
ncbi:MFS transporter [Luteibacter sp. Lutesp34]|uniref:MFS transporter n=1 Tax=Luteibacter sp. Lutesp34 TaxID=3243030 RepID=UPI0039B68562